MKSLHIAFVLFLLLTLHANISMADDEQSQITHTIKSQWEKPNAPLQVEPIVIVHNFAIADWFQQEKAGRALLHKQSNHWSVVVCAGDALKEIDSLVNSGVPEEEARKLNEAINKAEQQLSVTQLTKLSDFKAWTKMTEHPIQP